MTAKKARKRRKAVLADDADVDPRPILERLERERMMLVEGGERKRVSVLEALVRRQFAAAMRGNPRAVRQITTWAEAYLRLPQDQTIPIIVVPNEF